MISITVKKDPKSGENYLDLADFKHLFDTKKIKYYTLDVSDSNQLKLFFFDKNKKPLKPKK